MPASRKNCILGCNNTSCRECGFGVEVKFYKPKSVLGASWKIVKRKQWMNAAKNYVKSYLHLVYYCLLLTTTMISSVTSSATCPNSCQCSYDINTKTNRSTCIFGYSTVNITFDNTSSSKTIRVDCQGTNYTCDGIPQYHIPLHYPSLIVNNCTSRMFRCFGRTRFTLRKFNTLEIYNHIGPYDIEDFTFYDEVEHIVILFRDGDKNIPVDVINSLKTLTSAQIFGGNLELHSNVFNQSKIFEFYLSHNNINSIPADAFKGLTVLDKILIDNNNIREISPDAFRGLNSNRKINLEIRNNHADLHLGSQFFSSLPASVKEISMSNCKIRYLPENILNKNLRTIDLSDNEIDILPPKLFRDMDDMRYILMNNNSIRTLPKEIFTGMKYILKIDLSFNHIETWTSDLLAPNTPLRILNLRHNNIKHIDLKLFNETKLRNLDISSNKLQRLSGYTEALSQMKTLNLSHNELNLFEDWFIHLKHLENLDLNGNNLQVFKESTLYNFSSKTTIDLRNNAISKIIRDIPHSSTLLQTKSNITLYLAPNPLICDCLLTTIVNEWKTYGYLADFKDITCADTRRLPDINLLCTQKTHGIMGLVGFFCTLLLIIFLITIYATRKIFWNYIKNLLNDNKNLTEDEMKQDLLKQYDVFISFAHKDSDFVDDVLLPKLEIEFNQKVCVQYRDWIIGDLIPDQIVQSVVNSRITIVILSEHFLASEWSRFELCISHYLGIQDIKRKVIIIILDKSVLQHKLYSIDIKSYVISNTSLLWRDSKFWQKLQKLLPRRVKT